MTSKPPAPNPNQGRLFIGAMLGLVVLGGIASFFISVKKAPMQLPREEGMVYVTPIPRVSPPAPVKPEPLPEVKKKMEIQDPVVSPTPPPAAPVPIPLPPAGLSSKTNGTGPAIGPGDGGGPGGDNTIGTDPGGSKWGYYAAKVQAAIKDKLTSNENTRSATFSMQVRVWADANGRISNAQLVGSFGSPAVDQAIKDQILTGLQLPEPSPAGMPMPITMRIAARHST